MGTDRAIKRIHKAALEKEKGSLNNIMREFELLKELDHPNVMKVYEAYEDSKDIFIVTELLKGGELFDQLLNEHQFVESKCAHIMKQILYALSYCHDKKLAHR